MYIQNNILNAKKVHLIPTQLYNPGDSSIFSFEPNSINRCIELDYILSLRETTVK